MRARGQTLHPEPCHAAPGGRSHPIRATSMSNGSEGMQAEQQLVSAGIFKIY